MNKLLLMTVLGLAWATVCLADETYLGKLSANPYGEGMSFTGMMTVDQEEHRQEALKVSKVAGRDSNLFRN